MVFVYGLNFALTDPGGKPVPLRSFLGRYVVLYFYPKAGTPGCTREAQAFQERLEALRGLGAEVVGVSPDGPEALARFAAKHGLTFPLLSDPEGKLAEAYGVKAGRGRWSGRLRGSWVCPAACGWWPFCPWGNPPTSRSLANATPFQKSL